jgi:ribosomal protein L28
MRKITSNSCEECGKSDRVGYWRPNSLHRTKKVIKPNLQKHGDEIICTRCKRSIAKIKKAA